MVNCEYKLDCGYGWVVVAACFSINFIMAGLARAAGVLYVALIDVYGVSRETATAPFSLRYCIRNLSGPAVGALGQRFGIRPIVLLGGLICGLGGILSALAPDVTWITAAWGGIHGLGYGMCNLIHIAVINSYFHKYKGMAIGISLTGDCVGTFLLPPVLECLLSTYDLRGTFLIMAGLSLNVVPAAMLLKSPPWEEKTTKPSSLSHKKIITSESGKRADDGGQTNLGFDIMSEVCDDKLKFNNIENNGLPVIKIDEPESNQAYSKNSEAVKDDVKETKSLVVEYENKSNAENIDFSYYNINKSNFMNDALINDIQHLRGSASLRVPDGKMKKRFRFNSNPFKMKDRRTSNISILSCPSQVGKFDFGSRRKSTEKVYSICNSESQTDMKNPGYTQISFPSQRGKDLDVLNESQLHVPNVLLHGTESLGELKLYEMSTLAETQRSDSDAKDASALKDFLKTNIKPIFLVICASLAIYSFLFISVFTVIVDYVHDNGISSECGKYLIIAFSVTDVFGRIGFGVVLDKKWIPLKHFAGLVVGLMGFFVLIIPFYKCFVFWMICLSLCGFVQGGVSVMFPGLVEYYMDKNEETVALGSLNFYGGVLMFPIPPMIGYFRDNIGSYDGVFWTVGALCIFVASLWILEPCLYQKQEKYVEDASDKGDVNNNQSNA